ncbi:MAG: CPBP family intramembrane metalloprotease [Clostridiales bacterium]|nr:CPBP family intramembrane metalloprotease [Clostridiales bacterium]
MENKAFRRGLTITSIVLIALSAFLMSYVDARHIMYGSQELVNWIFFTAALAIPFLAILIVLSRYYNSTDTLNDLFAVVGIKYSIFGWFFVFGMRIAVALMLLFCYDFFVDNYYTVYLLMNAFNVCVVGTVVLSVALRKVPKVKIEKHRLKFGHLLLLIMMMYGLSQVGSLMGMPIHLILSAIGTVGKEQESIGEFQTLLMGSSQIVMIITVGILPAIFEELLFRKFLIDRTIRHGEFISCAMSGIMFGLWHGNFQQFFFAFFIGVLFAFVYIRTGNIIYTMIMHCSMNLVTTTVTTQLLQKLLEKMGVNIDSGTINESLLNSEAVRQLIPVILLTVLWLIILTGFQITGFVLFIVKRKKFKLTAMEGEPPRKVLLRSLTHNPEMWVFFSFALLLFVHTYLPDYIAFFASM